MRKIALVFGVFISFLVMSCGNEGPVGPQGATGATGADGVNILGTVIDVSGNFDENFDLIFDFPADEIEVFDSDVVLVYILWDIDEDSKPIWRLMPQTIFHEKGMFQYNYDYTFTDVSFFMEGNFDLTELEDVYTQDLVFRIAILPAENIDDNGRIDVSDVNSIMSSLGVAESQVKMFNQTN